VHPGIFSQTHLATKHQTSLLGAGRAPAHLSPPNPTRTILERRLSCMASPVNRSRLRAAWVVAVLVDGLQMITAPAEVTGPMAWVLEVGLDLVTMSVMIFLVGFHWTFLPSFVTKLLPFVDLAPTWTLALFIATRDRRKMKPFDQA